MEVGAAGDHLPAILTVYAFHQGGGGADDVGLGEAETGDPVIQFFAQQQGFVLRAAAVLVAVGEFDELAKWGIAVAAAGFDLGGVKFVVIVAGSGIDAKVLGVEGLDDYLTGFLAAPGPTGYLGEQCKGAFGGGKIGQHEGDVGGDDSHQRDAGQIESFGDHLCAD